MKAFLGFLLFSLSLLISPSDVAAKDYYFPQVKIQIDINPDSSFEVLERRTYSFSGSFSWAKLWIPTRVNRQGNIYDVEIFDFDVYEETMLGYLTPLRFSTALENGKFNARWEYQAYNETKTFVFSYHARGEGVKKYTDIAEFYWQVIGDGWEKPSQNIEVLITLPEGSSKEDIKVFGHGPLSGVAEIVDDRIARFTVPELSPKTFVEVRVLFPPNLVSREVSSEKDLASILAEEEKFRLETLKKIERQRLMKTLLTFLLLFSIFVLHPLIIILWLYFYYKTWKRVGDDYDFSNIPRYIKEPPSSFEPALVENLLREGGKVSSRSLVATIFDLARTGFITIKDEGKIKSGFLRVKTEYKTTLIKKHNMAEDGLKSHEKMCLDYLFETIGNFRDQVTFTQIKDYIKSRSSFKNWFEKWQRTVQKSGKSLGFMEKEGNKQTRRFWIISGLLTLIGSPVLLLGVFLIPHLKRRSYRWAKEAGEWKAFKRFLDDFSKFKELPPESYKLWEVYLVFGIIFGNAEKIIKVLPIILRDERATQAAWYTSSAYGGIGGGFKGISNLSSNLGGLASALTSVSASSISTGSGGGFSGGGGGGGGGGGSAG